MALQIKRTNNPNATFEDAGLVPGQLAYNYASGELAIGPYSKGNSAEIIGGKKFIDQLTDLINTSVLKSDFGEGSIVRNIRVTEVKNDLIKIESEIFNAKNDSVGTKWPLYLKVSGLQVAANYLAGTSDVSGLIITNEDIAKVNKDTVTPQTQGKRVLMQSISFDEFSPLNHFVTGWMVDLDTGNKIGVPINVSGLVSSILSPLREDIKELSGYFRTDRIVQIGTSDPTYPIISGLGEEPSQEDINKAFDTAISAFDQKGTDRGIVYSVAEPSISVYILESITGTPSPSLNSGDIVFIDLDPSEQNLQVMKAWGVYDNNTFNVFSGAFSDVPKQPITFTKINSKDSTEITGLTASIITGVPPILEAIEEPRIGDTAIVLRDETNNNQTWKWRYFDRNGDGIANWVPVAIADADTVYTFTEPYLSLNTGNIVSFNKNDLIDASDSARTYTISGGIIFRTGLMNHDRPYLSEVENLYFSLNEKNGFNGQGGRYLVSDKILSDYALRKIQLYGQEISSGMFSLGRGMGNFQNITGVVTTLSGSTFNTGETLSISGYIDNADGKFVINKFDLDDGEW